jgi:hypothetical protein
VGRLFASVGLFIVVGCAPTSPTVPPSSEASYQGLSCQQLADERLRLQAAIAAANEQQSKPSSQNVAGVIVFGMPESSWSGDSGQPGAARYRAQQEAVQKVAARKKCPAVSSPVS